MTTNKLRFLALGDSYTIGEAVNITDSWPYQLIQRLNATKPNYNFDIPAIIAQTGWRTDQLADNLKGKKLSYAFDLVSLLVGVNDQYQGRSARQYEIHFTALLEKAVLLAHSNPNHVMVLSIPDYGYTPFGLSKQATISAQIARFNEVNLEAANKMKSPYYNITEMSQNGLKDPTLIAQDGLHPSVKQYAEWVQYILHHPLFPYPPKN